MTKKTIMALQLLFVVLFVNATEKYVVYPTESKIIFDMCFFEKGEKLAVADNTNIKIFSTRTQQKLDEIETSFSDRILAVDVSKDDKILACGGRNGIVMIWDLQNKTTIQSITLSGHIISALSISPDSKFVAIGMSDGKVVIFDVVDKYSKFELIDHKKDITSLEFSPDGKLLATAGGDKKINLYSVENGNLITSLTGHKSWVRNISFSGNNKLMSCGDDTKVIQWDLPDIQKITFKTTNHRQLKLITSMDIFSDNSSYAISGINGKILILSQTGTYSANLKKPINKVLFIPYENFIMKLVVARRGSGVFQIKADEMILKSW